MRDEETKRTGKYIPVFFQDGVDYEIRRIGFNCTCSSWRTDDMGQINALRVRCSIGGIAYRERRYESLSRHCSKERCTGIANPMMRQDLRTR